MSKSSSKRTFPDIRRSHLHNQVYRHIAYERTRTHHYHKSLECDHSVPGIFLLGYRSTNFSQRMIIQKRSILCQHNANLAISFAYLSNIKGSWANSIWNNFRSIVSNNCPIIAIPTKLLGSEMHNGVRVIRQGKILPEVVRQGFEGILS